MCTTNSWTYVYPDGRRRDSNQRVTLCAASRHGQPCANNRLLKHPEIIMPMAAYPAAPIPLQQPPPLPPYHWLPPTPPIDDSDRVRRRSTSDNRRSGGGGGGGGGGTAHRQPSGRRLSSRDRVVLVENPPSARTPPQTYSTPHTAPSSPRFTSSSRPVIVDERQQLPDDDSSSPSRHRYRQHRRDSSASSRDSSMRPSSRDSHHHHHHHHHRHHRHHHRRLSSNGSNYILETETEARQRRQLRTRQRIIEANAEIAGRPPVPLAPTPRRRSSTYDDARETELVETLRRLDLEERRLVQRVEEDERLRMGRLRERMELPRRRSTVGPGARRHRVVYDDGIYRWE
ncbi:hypothetical protein L249_6678 [Ophiocordyceps polyrhachis-furcata BCC 54312]|uniref:Uncharacterized protein n=1 Tax=Ophiocordyceps polyrhachis-furcata BCC 54312 TaxID=1330021 RepID=A0A367LKW2_9HYPO|nr:hypothetical protein L249_6678 [Ophiocordyceps polyrhachis-furcata BCC 54312]